MTFEFINIGQSGQSTEIKETSLNKFIKSVQEQDSYMENFNPNGVS